MCIGGRERNDIMAMAPPLLTKIKINTATQILLMMIECSEGMLVLCRRPRPSFVFFAAARLDI